MFDGFINLLKPPGPTSHDMVAFVRKLLGIKRIGHAGTLDPLASGVLVLAVGRATRLIQYLEKTKTYRGEITFGIATDTFDADGKIVTCSPTRFERKDLENVLLKFTGPISQVPPMTSALKWRGQRLYNLARKGIEIDRKPRHVLIQELELLSLDADTNFPRALIECSCSGGTYIRSLAADIGTALDCGAYLSFLLRTKDGPFTISASITPEELKKYIEKGLTSRWLCLPQEALPNLPDITLGQKDADLFSNGNQVKLQQGLTMETLATTVRVHNYNKVFLGIGQLKPASTGNYYLKPEVVFN